MFGKYIKTNPEVFTHLVLGGVVTCIVAFGVTVIIRSSRGARKMKTIQDEGFVEDDHSPYTSLTHSMVSMGYMHNN